MSLAIQVPYDPRRLEQARALGLAAIQLRLGPGFPLSTEGTDLTAARAAAADLRRRGLRVAALGYYRNLLEPAADARKQEIAGLRQVMAMAPVFGTDLIGVFAGRHPERSIDDNLPLFEEVWAPLAADAETAGLRFAFENCTMFKGYPLRGINFCHTPYAYARMFERLDASCLGIELDPSHLVKQRIDVLPFVESWADRIFHVHAKDHRRDAALEQQHGCFSTEVSHDRLPGEGEVDFAELFRRLAAEGYSGDVTLEVERGMLPDGPTALPVRLLESVDYLKVCAGQAGLL